MVVDLIAFAKKHNSTAVPPGGGTPKTGTLRDRCSIQAPIIGFAIAVTESPAQYNYAHIAAFNRYYYITDWEWSGGLWWAYMQVDALASFKDRIANQFCYVLRASAEYDNNISDGLYPSKAVSYGYSPAEYEEYTDTYELSGGTYIVGVIGKGESGVGAVNYYALTPDAMNTLRNSLLTDTNYIGVVEITNELLKALLNPFQYIVSCTWFPFSYSRFASAASVSAIKLGWWSVTASAKVLSGFTVTMLRQHVTVTPVPQAVTDGAGYRLSSPFSSYTMVIPPFGEIELDAKLVASEIAQGAPYSYETSVEFTVRVDLISGNGYLEAWLGNHMVAFREGKFGVPTQLGQITQNVGGAITGVVGGLASVATGNAFVGAVGGIMSGLDSATPRAQTTGLNAGITLFYYGAYVTSKYNPPVSDDLEENGKPLCKTKQISSIPGFIKCMNSHVIITGATDAETQTIRNVMNEGFYYE